MFGLIGALIGWLSYHLGLRTDVASATGSLHAKIADLKTYVDTLESLVGTASPGASGTDTLFKYLRKADFASKTFTTNAPTASAQTNTILSISGAGYIVSLYSNGAASWTIQIDGGSIYTISADAAHRLPLSPIRFNTSLVVKASVVGGNGCNAWAILD